MSSTETATTPGQDPVVVFCNVCNQSIPESALKDGRAVRLPNGGCPTASLGSPAPKKASSPGGLWLLAPAVLMLGGVLAGVLYLDSQIAKSDQSNREQMAAFSSANRVGGEALARVDESLATLAPASDLDALAKRLRDLDDRLESLQRAIGDRIGSVGEQVAEVQRQQGRDREQVVQLAARAALIREDLRSVAAGVSELRAAPRSGPVSSVGGDSEIDDPIDPVVETGLPPELAHLASQLEDEDGATRYEAVDQLLRSGDKRVFALVLPLARDPDLFVRRVVLEGLAQERSVESVDALLRALADPESLVRDTATRGLRDLTKQNLPFDPDAREEQRSAMQRRWQKWWDGARDSF